jgi:hypothetical protein
MFSDNPSYLPTHWNLIAAVLRLSAKYDIKGLRHRVITVLDRYFPTTFAELTAQSDLTTQAARHYAVSVIKLAREVNILHILPVAFYVAATRSMKDLCSIPEHDNLSYSDMLVCMRGRERLIDAGRRLAFDPFLSSLSNKCCNIL